MSTSPSDPASPPADADSTLATQLSASPLGQRSALVEEYDPSLLFPLPREGKRSELGLRPGAPLPFTGADLWTGYELSWLTPRGKPVVALLQLVVPCETPCIVESKSFKLYLNSYTMSRYAGLDDVRERLVADLSAAFGARIGVKLLPADAFADQSLGELDGLSLDRLDLDCDRYTPAPELLVADPSQAIVSETLCSHLLKSNCLVTGQPDWGSLQISYSGAPIDHAGLLRYIVSYRQHHEFHEQCVERIFMDLWTRCEPVSLAVYARYTRRGGLDINPWRTSQPAPLPTNVRGARQ